MRGRLGRLASAACLVGCLAWSCAAAYSFGYDYPGEKHLGMYAYMGEILEHGIRDRASVVSYRMPLATLTSARLLYHSGLSSPELLALYQAVFVVLLFALGGLLHPLGAFFSAAAVLVYGRTPSFNLHPDSGYVILVLLTACVLVWRARAPTAGKTALLAAAVGATLLYRSPLALFTPVLALFERLARRGPAPKDGRRQAMILCLAPYAVLLPWLAMNWSVHGRLIVFEKGAANSNIVTGAMGLVENIEGDLRTLIDEPIDLSRSGEVLGWATREVARHPLRYARACAQRAAFAFSLHPALILLAALSLWLYRKRPEFQQLGLLAGYFLSVHCLMTVESRYFWPLWPLAAVLAGALLGAWSPQARPQTDSGGYRLAATAAGVALVLVTATSAYAGWSVLAYAARARVAPARSGMDYDLALAEQPSDAWLLEGRALQRLSRGDVSGAARDLTAAVRTDPSEPRFGLRLAYIHALQGYAIPMLRWRPPPQSITEDLQLRLDARILQAGALIRLGREREAAPALKDALELYKARNVMVRGPHGEIERGTLQRLRSSDAGFAAHCTSLLAGRPDLERTKLNDIMISLLPESSRVWLERAELAARSGRGTRALEALARAETLRADDAGRDRLADAWLQLATRSAERGDRRGTLDAAARAEGSTLDDAQRRRLVDIYRRANEPRRALSLIQQISRSAPRDTGLMIGAAEISGLLGDRGAALALLGRAAALGPGAAERHRIALTYQSLGEHGRALDTFDELVAGEPATSRYRADRGLCRHLAGDSRGAIEDLQAAIQSEPSRLEPYLTLGAIYAAQGRRTESLRIYDQALSVKAPPEAQALRRLVLESRREAKRKTP